MSKKKQNICIICSFIAVITFLVYFFLSITRSNPCLSLIFVSVATIALVIRLGIEISSKAESWTTSVWMIALCVFHVAFTVMHLG